MKITTLSLSALALTAALALAGCGSDDSAADGGGSTSPATTTSGSTGSSGSSSDSTGSASAGLATASTSLGTVVTDAAGRAVYVFDSDTQGATSSSCTGACVGLWPAVPAGGTGTGVTGTVGSITGVNGKPQATLDGWPLYYYAGDSKPGDVTGQAVGGIWWVVAPDGSKITTPASDSGSAPATGGSSYGKDGY